MNCAELQTRLHSLRVQIYQITQKIDELEKIPRTNEIQNKIDELVNEKYELERDVAYWHAQYKKKCK